MDMEYLKYLLTQNGVLVASANITSVGTNVLNALKGTTFKVSVTDWPNDPEVKVTFPQSMDVVVQNWPDTPAVKVSNFPSSIAVSNFPSEVKVSNIPSSIEVSNIPEEIKVSNIPSSIEVSNTVKTEVQNWPNTVDVDIQNWPDTQQVSVTGDVTTKGTRNLLFQLQAAQYESTIKQSAQIQGGRAITGYIYNGSDGDITAVIMFDGNPIQKVAISAGGSHLFDMPAACSSFSVHIQTPDDQTTDDIKGAFYLHY